jgi:hypothetical protein
MINTAEQTRLSDSKAYLEVYAEHLKRLMAGCDSHAIFMILLI